MGSDRKFKLPVVDLGGATGKQGSEARAAVVAQLRKALHESESCHVINHGVPLDLLDDITKRSTEFFNLPREERVKYNAVTLAHPPTNGAEYLAMIEGLNRFPPDPLMACNRETFQYFTRPVEDRLPHKLPEMLRGKKIEVYSDALHGLAVLLLELLSEGYGLQSSAFIDGLGPDDMQVFQINWYPPSETNPAPHGVPDSVLGAPPHIDTSTLTILHDNLVPGLQVLQKSGEWVTVTPLAGAFVVQPGAVLEVLTNGAMKAPMHRVVNPKIPSPNRISIVSGYRTSMEATIKPLPQLLGSDNHALFKPLHVATYIVHARGINILGKDALDPWKNV